MNKQENKPLKDYTDQALFRKIFTELERRIKIDPAPFISWSKKFLPILRLVSGEKNCICQGHQTKLQDYTDEELANEITRRINNFSLDVTRLLIPMVVIGSQYYQWYKEKRKETNPKEDK